MKTHRFFPLILLALPLLGVPASAFAADTPAKTAKSTDGKAATDSNDSTVKTTDYVLSPTDVITVEVVDDGRATHDYKIGADGAITLTYLLDHPVTIGGRTLTDATKAIVQAYIDAKIFIKPQITVSVKEYASRRINVNGAVAHAGWVIIPPEENLTLVDAISQAGGVTGKASEYAKISRKNPDGTTYTFTADLLEAIKDQSKDIPLQAGDSIFLGESAFGTVYQ